MDNSSLFQRCPRGAANSARTQGSFISREAAFDDLVGNMTEKTPDETYLEQFLGRRKEGNNLEFKAASNQFDSKKLFSYCAAISNERGGQLILGVTDKLPREVCGTAAFSNVEDTEHKIYQQLHIKVLVREVDYGGKRVLIFQIPPRPAGVPVIYDGKYLMRAGESLVPMTPDQLRQIFDEPRGHFLLQPAKENLTSEEVFGFLDVKPFWTLSETSYPNSDAQKLDVLRNHHLVAQIGSEWLITNLGALILAKSFADFGLSGHGLRFTKYSGVNKVRSTRDQIYERGYALCFEAFLESVVAEVPTDERIEAAFRASEPIYRTVVLRELIANAIVHQDFEVEGSHVLVEMYDDRIEVVNRGEPILEVVRFVEHTKPRNPDLAKTLRELKMCESRGSGLQRVLDENDRFGRPDPQFRTGDEITKAVLIGRHNFADMPVDERVWAAFMHCCLKWVSNDYLTNASMRKRFGLPDSKSSFVSNIISMAVDQKLIAPRPTAELTPSKRHAKYVPFYAL